MAYSRINDAYFLKSVSRYVNSYALFGGKKPTLLRKLILLYAQQEERYSYFKEIVLDSIQDVENKKEEINSQPWKFSEFQKNYVRPEILTGDAYLPGKIKYLQKEEYKKIRIENLLNKLDSEWRTNLNKEIT